MTKKDIAELATVAAVVVVGLAIFTVDAVMGAIAAFDHDWDEDQP